MIMNMDQVCQIVYLHIKASKCAKFSMFKLIRDNQQAKAMIGNPTKV